MKIQKTIANIIPEVFKRGWCFFKPIFFSWNVYIWNKRTIFSGAIVKIQTREVYNFYQIPIVRRRRTVLYIGRPSTFANLNTYIELGRHANKLLIDFPNRSIHDFGRQATSLIQSTYQFFLDFFGSLFWRNINIPRMVVPFNLALNSWTVPSTTAHLVSVELSKDILARFHAIEENFTYIEVMLKMSAGCFMI